MDKLQALMKECEKQAVPLPSAMQEPHNYIFPLSHPIKEFAAKNDLTLFLYSPLARGVLTGKYKNGVPPWSRGSNKKYAETLGVLEGQQKDRVTKLSELCRTHALTSAQLAYLYVLHSCPKAVMLCGFSRAAQVSEAEKSLHHIAERINYD